MRRLAIFVEGLTEELFVERFLTETTRNRGVRIEKLRASGGKVAKRSFTRVTSSADSPHLKVYVLIVNCGADNRVKSEISDQYDSLVAKGYKTIIGIRDAYPQAKKFTEVPNLRKSLAYKIRPKPCDVIFVLAVMEIEAWFISEHTHFPRISAKLTLEQIKKSMGYDPSKTDMQRRPYPAKDLAAIYHLAKIQYMKEEASIRRTLNALDFRRMHAEFGSKFEDLRVFIEKIDKLLPVAAKAQRGPQK